MTYSEFGRRVRPSDSAGTDHGTASVLFLVGNLVRGGLHGAQPSLTQLDSRGDLNISVDVRSVFASVLSRWLQADDRQVLGADWNELDLFVSAGSGGGGGGPGPSGESGGLGTMTPVRIVDTRSGIGLGRTVKLGPGERVDIPVAGRDGVPALGVGAAVMNVTVTQCDATGFLTVWPTGEPMPDASSLNFVADQSVPNLVIAKLGAAGHVSVFNSNGNTHLIVDVSGWFPADQAFVSLTPSRILDTRIGNGAPQAKVGPGAVVDLQVLGRGGVPNAGNVGAVAMNVTVDGPDSESFVTVWPKGEGLPDASNLNMRAGQTVPNLVVAKVGADGQVSLRNAFGSTDLIADVLGWFPTGVGLQALTPVAHPRHPQRQRRARGAARPAAGPRAAGGGARRRAGERDRRRDERDGDRCGRARLRHGLARRRRPSRCVQPQHGAGPHLAEPRDHATRHRRQDRPLQLRRHRQPHRRRHGLLRLARHRAGRATVPRMLSATPLEGKVAVVTGGGGGIGGGISRLFVAAGATVVVNDIDADLRGDAVAHRRPPARAGW